MVAWNKLGTALSGLGTTLMGIGLLFPSPDHASALWNIAAAGFIIKALGSVADLVIVENKPNA